MYVHLTVSFNLNFFGDRWLTSFSSEECNLKAVTVVSLAFFLLLVVAYFCGARKTVKAKRNASVKESFPLLKVSVSDGFFRHNESIDLAIAKTILHECIAWYLRPPLGIHRLLLNITLPPRNLSLLFFYLHEVMRYQRTV